MCSISLYILAPPKGPLKAEEIRANHVVLAWKKPDDAGKDCMRELMLLNEHDSL